uniref:Homeobox containing 1 n=1 Tax=Sinocyclocheilus rhinocerous TaxID=307959 RepID=A0A673NLG8_9TELE
KLTSFPLLTMSHYTDEPRFTIEQIDLLQRLRRSGMTKQEILHALDTLDRLDREHVEKFGHRHAHGGSGAASVNHASSSTISTATQTGYRGNGLSPSPSNSYDTSPPPTVPTPVPVVAPLVQNGRDLAAMPNGKLSPPRFAVMGNSRDGTIVLTKFGVDLFKSLGGVRLNTTPENGKNGTKLAEKIQNNRLPCVTCEMRLL